MSKKDTKENLMPKRSRRMKYSQEQMKVLERVFEDNHYPDTLQQENLALKLDVTFDRISIWFQNRRSRFKRQRQEEHLSHMRRQIYRDVLMDQGALGTPKLQSLLSACHVLSPIETNIGRGDSPGDSSRTTQLADPERSHMTCTNEMSVSGTPPCLYPWQMSHTQYIYHPSYQSSTLNGYATPTRPPLAYQTTPHRTSCRVPFTYQTPQDWFPAFMPSDLPSLHSLSYSQTTRSPQHLPSYHDNISQITRVPQRHPSYHDNTSAFAQPEIIIYPRTNSAITNPPESAISEDTESSPSNNALDCLAQWC